MRLKLLLASSVILGLSYSAWPNDLNFTQQALLTASNAGLRDNFGRAVAISGDTMVIGAPREDSSATSVNGDQTNDATPDAGAVYVFVRSGSSWTQQAYLKPSNTRTGDLFGYAVAISGDTIVVGAPQDDLSSYDPYTDVGAAYVFVRDGTNWTQQAYLQPPTPVVPFPALPGILFGITVAVSGHTVVIGAPYEGYKATGVNGTVTDLATQSGAAYVFVRSGTSWSQQAYLKASNTDSGDNFGSAVAISLDTIVIGAPEEDSNGNQTDNSVGGSGAVYVFTRTGSDWTQQAYLKASNTVPWGTELGFGVSAAISGDTLVTGGTGWSAPGAAYVFVRNGTAWSEQARLESFNIYDARMFSASVSIDGDTVAVASPLEDNYSGAAFVFSRAGTAWTPTAYLRSSSPAYGEIFGFPVAVSGNTVVSGAEGNSNFADGAGAVYVFVPNTPPAIAPAAVSQSAGASGRMLIASVSDAEVPPGSLAVSVESANPSNGVMLSNIVNHAGNVTADVAAACSATNTSFILRVTDSSAAFADGGLNVTITPAIPSASASVALSSLMPADSNFINVGLAVATGNCSPALQVNVYSNEDDGTPSAPNTVHSPDARNIASDTLELRAERVETGNGRVYLIVVKATTTAGNAALATTTVVVPSGQSQNSVDTVNAMAESARAYALANNGNPPPGYFVIGYDPLNRTQAVAPSPNPGRDRRKR